MRLALLLLIATSAAQAQQAQTFRRVDGQNTPAMVFSPIGICHGTAILSHGAGGTERGLRYMAEHLQSKGWLAVTVGHAESGPDVLRAELMKSFGRREGLRDGLGRMLADAKAFNARFNDIQAALDWSKGRCSNPFTALIGHSMGAATTLLLAGANNRLGLKTQIAFNAYVAMSAQGVGALFPKDAWHAIKAPVYVLTGTKDQAQNGDWTTRLAIYRSLPAGCAWQGVIEDANHMAFGRGGNAEEKELITGSVSAFLSAVKNGQCNRVYKNPGIAMLQK
jgi:dienelactone hydrolase